jgi:hypothetical protein
MTYPETKDLILRTNESMRQQTQRNHHHGISPFTSVSSIDMAADFPIDYMHQACLGVMRRLLFSWKKGTRPNKLSAAQVQQITDNLVELRLSIPSAFARKPRGLGDLEYWKATEFRQFLLYTGQLVLKGVLRDELYSHFMTLCIAMRILVSPALVKKHSAFAQELLVYFVQKGSEIYGNEFLVYNVHSMLHLTDAALRYGCLDKCSGFPFENFLGRMKKMARSGNKPLQQIVKRTLEQEHSNGKPQVIKAAHKFWRPNNAFVLSKTSCCETVSVTNETDSDGKRLVLCRVYRYADAKFTDPCDSRTVGIYKFKCSKAIMRMLPESALSCKAILVQRSNSNNIIFISILHDITSETM